MPIERFACLAIGAGLMLALLFAGASRIPPHWDKLTHCAVFGLATALLLRGTAGRAPLMVLAAVLGFGAFDELRRSLVPGGSADLLDFVADAAAALAVAGFLVFKGKSLCAESSQR